MAFSPASSLGQGTNALHIATTTARLCDSAARAPSVHDSTMSKNDLKRM